MIFKPLSSNARTHLLALEVFLDTLFCKKEEGLESIRENDLGLPRVTRVVRFGLVFPSTL